MNLIELSLNDWFTVIVIIAQAGIVYDRLKKVEQKTERFDDLVVELAVCKNSLENHRNEFEKQSVRIEKAVQKLDDRLLGIETRALLKQARLTRETIT